MYQWTHPVSLEHTLTLSQMTSFLDSSKLKGFADDNFTLEESGRQFSKQVGNTVGIGEIARHEQFLHFPRCLQKTSSADTLKAGLVLEGVNVVCKLGRILSKTSWEK